MYDFSDIFYVRNHLPVPEIDADSYELEIEVEGTNKTKVLTLKNIQALPKYHVTAAIMVIELSIFGCILAMPSFITLSNIV